MKNTGTLSSSSLRSSGKLVQLQQLNKSSHPESNKKSWGEMLAINKTVTKITGVEFIYLRAYRQNLFHCRQIFVLTQQSQQSKTASTGCSGVSVRACVCVC